MADKSPQKRRSLLNHLRHAVLPTRANKHHPHVLKREVVVGVLSFALIIEVCVFSQCLFFFKTSHDLASVLPAVVDSLTNDQRTQNGLDALTVSPLLTEAAQDKANDMAAKGYFSHVSPDGTLPWYWFDQVGYNYQFAGENLAVNFNDSDDVVNAWMNSPMHRANILKQQYTEIGVGMATGMYEGKSTIFVVQFFGRPESDAIAGAAAAPTATVESAPSATASGIGDGLIALAGKAKTALSDVSANIPAPTELMTTTSPARPQKGTVAAKPSTKSASYSATTTASTTVATGEASDVLGIETERPAPAGPSEFQRLLASPFTVSKYIFIGIATMFVLVLLLALIFRKRLPRMTATIGGLAIVVILLGLAIANQKYLSSSGGVNVNDSNTANTTSGN